ncbi:MAG: exodeoxyribonuclease V subunit gamma [Deltaproteobacteria bacterium]|nr:exodeoxyribonuclease V subunit gamma [Deltaproteobacteria bacterium]
MAGFFVHSSNQMEELARVLAEFLLEKKSGCVLAPEIVVVPSRGLERWLKLYLARVNGIAANLEFPFPQAFLEEKVFAGLRRRLDPGTVGNPFTLEALAWKIFFALQPDHAPGPVRSPELATYLTETGDELSRYQLALALADLFDRYLLVRPELIRAWERGENPLAQLAASKWQKELWASLLRGQGGVHFAALHELLNQIIYPEFFPEAAPFSVDVIAAALPSRLFIFGFAALPFTYFDIFKGLSRLTEVHLFHCNPCAEYWGDQYRRRVDSGFPRSFSGQPLSGEAENGAELSAGHPLLASWGRLGRAFFDLISGLEVEQYNEHFVVPDGDSLLTSLQRQILLLAPPEKLVQLAAADSSLQIHRCHGRRREVEILYDTILDTLEHDADLELDDILVMAPDIDLYAPYIEALFAHRQPFPGGSPLTFTLVSAKSALRQPVIRALLDLLRLSRSRFHLSEVFDLFSQEVVCRRFSVGETGLARLADWLRQAAVNWGLDGDFRQETVGVNFSEHSFSWGLDRLLAGYALAGNGLGVGRMTGGSRLADEVWSAGCGAGEDLFPLPGIEGEQALVLGSFCAFITALAKARQRLRQPLPAVRWRTELESLVNDFIQPDADAAGCLASLRQTLRNFEQQLERAGVLNSGAMPGEEGESLSTETVIAALEKSLEEFSGRAGFFAGGITFSSILPLRALPARMICLLGLNDGEFPRSQRPPAYDLIAASPRPGDRNARDEDRYLFLETLLAARKTLVLSYIGRDPKDNHLRPPSILLSELIDYIEEHFRAPLKGAVSADSTNAEPGFLLYDHPPQPFSPRYFQAPAAGVEPERPFFSYDAVAAAMAATMRHKPERTSDFLGLLLPLKLPEEVGPYELVRFYSSPARYFLKERLKVVPEISELECFADSEPFFLDPLDSYQLYDEMLAWLIKLPLPERSAPATVAELERRLAAAGKLPLPGPGRSVALEKIKTAIAMTVELAPFCAEAVAPLQKRVSLLLNQGSLEFALQLDGIYRGEDGIIRQVLYRPVSKIKEKDRIRTTILHLGLELEGQGVPAAHAFQIQETRLHTLSPKEQLVFPVRPAGLAPVQFKIMMEIFIEGLRRPLPFLPALSLPWYAAWEKELVLGDAARARVRAREKVMAQLAIENSFDIQDEAFSYCFPGAFTDEAFWHEFESLARRLGPIFADR